VRTVVTGGHGFIGSALLPALWSKGHEVALLARDPQRARAQLQHRLDRTPWLDRVGDLEIAPWSGADLKAVAGAMHGAQAVIHLAGESIAEGRWTSARKEVLRSSRIATTQNLAAQLPSSVEHFLCASAVGIYPQPAVGASLDEAQRLCEESFMPPDSTRGSLPFLEQLAWDWEQAALSAANSGLPRVVRMRIGIVLGREGFLQKLAPIYRLGLGGPVGSGTNWIPWIQVEDLVAAMVWILERHDLQGAVNLVGPQPVTMATLSAELARQLHRPHVLRVPEFAVRLGLGEKAFLATASCAAKPSALLASGFRFQYEECSSALAKSLAGRGT
jgi:uncharacterized protein (TIGR01777 family)